MDISSIILVLAGFSLGLIATWLLLRLRRSEMRTTKANEAAIENKLKVIAGEALKSNSESFLQLAEQKFRNLQQQADADLKKREQAVAHLVQPIRETLDKAREQISDIEKQRKQEYGSLQKQIEMTLQAQQGLREETGKLAQALKQPQVQGSWGEITLRRLVELSGMVKYCDFDEQVHSEDEQGRRLRPDMVVRMPNERIIVIDVKTPTSAYLEALNCENESERDKRMEEHARNVKNRMKELAEKSYWRQFDNSPDFVVLFIPGEQFLTAALDKKPGLVEWGMESRIIAATPTTLIALLRTIAYGWREKSLAENAEKVQQLGRRLYERVGIFTEHFSSVGKHLDNSVKSYNKATRSLESRLLSSAREFTEMGIQQTGKLEEPPRLETRAETPSQADDNPG